MIRPNKGRVLIKRLEISDKIKTSGVLISGQLKAGENLFIGEIVHAGDTSFKKGQTVYYSEYSAAALYAFDKKKSLSEVMKEPFYVVADDDIMAVEE